ncbi:MAG: hypothetical protein V1819_01425 [bacterium]
MLKEFLQKFQEKLFQRKKLLGAILPILFILIVCFPSKVFAMEPISIAALVTIAVVVPIIAGVVTTLTKALTFMAIIVGINTLALAFGGAFLWIATRILNWAIKGGAFAAWSMTNPVNNYIINIGWTLLRDLTNMFFILGLAYIGLATALNFASFNTKKTFITLIIVALLINFTPVICGLIVDGTNIISNFFLSEVSFDSASDAYASIANSQGMNAVPNIEATTWYQWLPRRMLLQYYSFLSGSILLIFASLFILRTFIIWFLVILSPVAFFCRIFSFSEQWFKKWWGLFIGWSIVVIPASFFLYLANHLMVVIKAAPKIGFHWFFPSALAALSDPVDAGMTIGFWGELLPYLLAMTFLVIGLIATLKIKTAGTGFIMNIANKAVKLPATISKKVGDTAGKAAGDALGAMAGGAIGAAGLRSAAKARGRSLSTPEGQAFAKKHKTRGGLHKLNRWAFGKRDEYTEQELKDGKDKTWGRRIGRGVAAIGTAGLPFWGRGLEATATATLRKQQDEYGKRAVGKDDTIEAKRAFKARMGVGMSEAEKARGTFNIIESGDFSDTWDIKDNSADRKQFSDILEIMLTTFPELFKKARLTDFQDEKDADGNVIRQSITHELMDKYTKKDKDGNVIKDAKGNTQYNLPIDIIDRAGLKTSASDRLFYGHGIDADGNINKGIREKLGETDDEFEIMIRKAMSAPKTGVEYMSKPGALEMLKSKEFNILGNPSQIAKAAELFGREAVDTINESIRKNKMDNPLFYEEFAPRFDRYYESTPARSLGINYFSGPSPKGEKTAADKQSEQLEELKKEKEKVVKELDQTIDRKKWRVLKDREKEMEKQINDLENEVEEEKRKTEEKEEENEEERKRQSREKEERERQKKNEGESGKEEKEGKGKKGWEYSP